MRSKTKKAILLAWSNAMQGVKPSPLLKAIGKMLKQIPDTDRDFRARKVTHLLAKQIANGAEHDGDDSKHAAMGYRTGWHGKWNVRNSDLCVFGRFKMWLNRFVDSDCESLVDCAVDPIDQALGYKRLQQALDRYTITGLTTEHCSLLANMNWRIDTKRGDWISLFVEGKRPFGNSSIEYDIYEHAGWPMDWPDDAGPSEAQDERAWNLFDELIFAAPDAAKLAAERLRKLRKAPTKTTPKS